jgi:bacillolysin
MFSMKITLFAITSILSCSVAAAVDEAGGNGNTPLMTHLSASTRQIIYDKGNGRVKFIGSTHGQTIPLPPDNTNKFAAISVPLERHINTWAPLLGIRDPQRDLSLMRKKDSPDKRTMARYQQLHAGLPVVGAELVMNLSSENHLTSIGGEVSDVAGVNTVPTVTESEAIETAIVATSKWHVFDRYQLTTTTPELSLYDPSIFHASTAPARLVWRLEVSSTIVAPVSEFILVDAQTGRIALHFNQVDTIKDRMTYSSDGTAAYEVTLRCNEADGDACTGGVDLDADAAHQYAGDAYDFFSTHHGRDSLDGAGMTLISNVDWNGGGCPNAFWDGTRMIYCDTLPLADDIVAHELTHGVTEHTSNLYYYYQSGAISESLSDIWGEFVDLENGLGTDSPAVKWLMGENASAFGGAIRSLKDPTLYKDPDRMSSIYYATGSADDGGVHTNSGIGNKAAYLMTDGDTFNGQTISGLGITKVAAVFYEAQTTLLTSASDYYDLHLALFQGCQTLIGGSEGITSEDCEEVRKATLAVEMDQQPEADFNPNAEQCPASNAVTATHFSDDFEDGLGQWRSTAKIAGATTWGIDTGYATSGTQSLFGNSGRNISDEAQEQKVDVALPGGKASYLIFDHAFEYESPDYDASLIEYSLNGGSSWNDAGGLINSGMSYNGTISTDPKSQNPEAGSSAFVDLSHGYVSSRLNLSPFAGQNIRFRFRIVTDDGTASPLGWEIDDVAIYSCNRPPVANAGSDDSVLQSTPYTLDGSLSSEPDSDDSIVSYSWSQLSGITVILSDSTVAAPGFIAPDVEGALEFSLTVTDTVGASATDIVKITVANTAPMANAGSDDTIGIGSTYTLNGSLSSDPDSGDSIASYNWTQLSGTTVSLSVATVANPSFTAPNVAGILEFSLTVTDTVGASDTDTVKITVVNTGPTANAGSDDAVTGGALYILDGSLSSDPDTGDSIASYNWTQLSGTTVSLSDPTVASPGFTAPNVVETLEFSLTITDTLGASASDSVLITILNTAPTANAGSDDIVTGGTLYTLDGSLSSDPDTGDSIASYNWTQLSGTTVSLSDPTVASPGFTAPNVVETLEFSLTITDTLGASASDSVLITILNTAPTANAGSDDLVNVGAIYTLDGSLSSDPDTGDAIASYNWIQLSGTTVSLSDPTVASPSFTAPNVAETLQFSLTVTDTVGASDMDTVQVTVSIPVSTGGGGGGGGAFGAILLALLLPMLFRQGRRRPK